MDQLRHRAAFVVVAGRAFAQHGDAAGWEIAFGDTRAGAAENVEAVGDDPDLHASAGDRHRGARHHHAVDHVGVQLRQHHLWQRHHIQVC
jgi:hypothetical protein